MLYSLLFFSLTKFLAPSPAFNVLHTNPYCFDGLVDPNPNQGLLPLTKTTSLIGSEKALCGRVEFRVDSLMKVGNACGNLIFLLFLLQRNYFSCQEQFDIKTLNSTYTQVSAKILSSAVEMCKRYTVHRMLPFWWIILINCATMCLSTDGG